MRGRQVWRSLSLLIRVAWVVACAPSLLGQSILSVAGSTLNDDDQPSTQAGLRYPTAVITDTSGNLLIAESFGNRVRQVDASSGIIRTIAGTGLAGFTGDREAADKAELHTPVALALDKSGSVLVVDTGNGRIRRIDRNTGQIITIAGGGNSTDEDVPATTASLSFPLLLDFPSGIAVKNDGSIVFVETGRHRVRRIDMSTGLIRTIAGNGTEGFSGDGGPARNAQFRFPTAIAIDSNDNIFVADTNNSCVRRIDSVSGVITTVAGIGGMVDPNSADGPAASTALARPRGLAIDGRGILHIADSEGRRVRRLVNGTIATVAGTGSAGPPRDGGAATNANLSRPEGISFDSSGNLLIADAHDFRIRRVAPDGSINTVAGDGTGGPIRDGGPAVAAGLFSPWYVVVDREGNVIFSDRINQRIRKIDQREGRISTVAGNGVGGFAGSYLGDGGPATAAGINRPLGVAVDSAGNIYIADTQNQVIRFVDASTKIITTIAGTGRAGGIIDGQPATSTPLNFPRGLTVAPNGDVVFADTLNHAIRKLDRRANTISTVVCCLMDPTDVQIGGDGDFFIADTTAHKVFRFRSATNELTTFAGSGNEGFSGDGGPAVLADMRNPSGLAIDGQGTVYIADIGTRTIRKVTPDGIISRVAGGGHSGFRDNGPALEAEIGEPNNVALSPNGDVYLPDTSSNKIRAVLRCVTVTPPTLFEPTAGASVNSNPTLAWSSVPGAFRYDVFLSTSNPPQTRVATDLTATSFKPSNLLPGTTYFWRVVAKGDPFCAMPSTATSELRSFVTVATCGVPGNFQQLSPVEGARDVTGPLDLRWSTAPGATSYDVYLGATNPPPFLQSSNSNSLRVPDLEPGETYYWSVVAKAACDAEKTIATSIRSFTIAGTCASPGAFAQTSPIGGVTTGTTTTLQWDESPNATSYDAYFGVSAQPPLYLTDLTARRVSLARLVPGVTYYWRVVANAKCNRDAGKSSSVASFTVDAGCRSPQPTSFSVVPSAEVGVGQTYVLAWRDSDDLGPDGFYIVERSLSATFETILDEQRTVGTSASFSFDVPGTLFHRVRATNGCSSSSQSAPSAIRSVTISTKLPNVIFTVQPEGVVSALNERLEDKVTRFVVENIGSAAVTVRIAREEIASAPFFTVIDPLGGDGNLVTLNPREPHQLQIRFSGPPNDRIGSYQGVVSLLGVDRELPLSPYAFVSLIVGGARTSEPEFRVGGVRSEYASFPGFAGDDVARDPISVEIRNPGSTPMELTGEVGPELWLLPEPGWNAMPIPPGGSRIVRLFSRRARALHASALPRYTYFTVRTRSGQTARLLVQDNDATPVARGRNAQTVASIRSFIIPEVLTTAASSSSRSFSTLVLTNVGSDNVQTELFFTPVGVDGFDAGSVQSATILIPANDVVTLTDPLRQLWSLDSAVGQLEVRAGTDKDGLLVIRSLVTRPSNGSGNFSYLVPAVQRDEGARLETSHSVPGVTVYDTTRSFLTLAETSGRDRAAVRVTLSDRSGNAIGDRVVEIPRLSSRQIDDFVQALTGKTTITAARLTIAVEAGAGSVIAAVKLLDRNTGGGATLISSATEDIVTSAGFITSTNATTRPSYRLRRHQQSGVSLRTFFIPTVVTSPLAGTTQRIVTGLGLSADSTPVNFKVTYREGDAVKTATVVAPRRMTIDYTDVLAELFGITPANASEGSILIEADGRSSVYARVLFAEPTTGKATLNEELPVIAGTSEFVTSAASPRPLYIDGVEQSIDPSRGSSWSVTLNEIGSAGGRVVVRMYEAGNRSTPIAEKEFALAPLQRLKLGNLFSALGLDGAMRRKDRTNVLVSAVLKSGSGAAVAIAQSRDNRTGDQKSFLLGPAGSTRSAFSVQLVTTPPSAPPVAKRRAIRH